MPVKVSRLHLGFVGAILALTISVIHMFDQGGLPLVALKDPAYIGYGYWAMEFAGIVAALLVVLRPKSPAGWLIGAAAAAGALVGFVLSRTTGLPNATDDINNWLEPLGAVSLFTDAAMLALAAVTLYAMRRHALARRRGRPTS